MCLNSLTGPTWSSKSATVHNSLPALSYFRTNPLTEENPNINSGSCRKRGESRNDLPVVSHEAGNVDVVGAVNLLTKGQDMKNNRINCINHFHANLNIQPVYNHLKVVRFVQEPLYFLTTSTYLFIFPIGFLKFLFASYK